MTTSGISQRLQNWPRTEWRISDDQNIEADIPYARSNVEDRREAAVARFGRECRK